MPESDREKPLAPASDIPLDSLRSVGAALADRPYSRPGIGESAEMIRVVVVDDHPIVRDGLKALLYGIPDVTVVGEAGDGREAIRVVAQTKPHVVVMDLDMPGGDGTWATSEIVAMERPPRVLILSMHSEEDRLIPLLKAGASGFVSKEAAGRDLVDAIRAVAAGEVYVRPQVARMLASSIRPAGRRTPADLAHTQFAALSDREQSVFKLVAEGFNGPEIGRKLGITAKTVATYKQRIQEKLGLAHRSEYVRFALTVRLIAPE